MEKANDNSTDFIVGPRAVRLPVGRFLLVRKGHALGAIRFTNGQHGESNSYGTASYESYFQGDGSGSFLASNVVKQSGEISLKPLTGIGRLSFGGGKRRLRVGTWSFACHAPGWMNMWPFGEDERDQGFEFAPTAAQELAEIQVLDKRLQWFRYDSNSSRTLHLSDLAK